MSKRTSYGERAACKYCGQDIEFNGGKSWTDRGGDRQCVPYFNKDREIVTPKTKHAPYREVVTSKPVPDPMKPLKRRLAQLFRPV